jgi:SNF family Na+-dependent transporter
MTIGRKFKKLQSQYIFLVLTIIAFIGSIPFMYGNGLYLLDIIDHYLMQYAIIIIWLAEILVFIYIWKKHTKYIMSRSDFSKKIINKYSLLAAWVLSAIGIFVLVILNFQSWFFQYDSYTKDDLMIWAHVLYIVLGLWICINIYEILNWKSNKKKLK